MSERIHRAGDTLVISLPTEERSFLAQVLLLLDEVDADAEDPGHRRLNVPVYLDDSEANAEWWRLMGEEIENSRRADREIYRSVMDSSGESRVSESDATAVLRVLNEGRLAFAARLGLEVEEDHDRLPEAERSALDYMGWILEDLTSALTEFL